MGINLYLAIKKICAISLMLPVVPMNVFRHGYFTVQKYDEKKTKLPPNNLAMPTGPVENSRIPLI